MEPLTPPILILDNGAHTIKSNLSPYNDPYSIYPSLFNLTLASASSSSTNPGPSGSVPPRKSHRKQPGKRNRKKSTHASIAASEIEQQEEKDQRNQYDPYISPNSIFRSRAEKRTYIGDEISRCGDFGGGVYRRPFEKVSKVDFEC